MQAGRPARESSNHLRFPISLSRSGCCVIHKPFLDPKSCRLPVLLQGGGEEIQGQPGAVAAVLLGDKLLPGRGGVAGLLRPSQGRPVGLHRAREAGPVLPWPRARGALSLSLLTWIAVAGGWRWWSSWFVASLLLSLQKTRVLLACYLGGDYY